MLKIYRVLGKKGRITIPYEIRQLSLFAQIKKLFALNEKN